MRDNGSSLFSAVKNLHFTEGFYTGSKPKRARLECVFSDMLEELERQVTVKLFDANRTLTHLTAEHRRTIEVDNIHVDIFECGLLEKMKGRNRTVNLLSALVEVLPAHSIIRRLPKGDFCIIAPVMICNTTLKETTFENLELPSTPHFACEKGELFVPLRTSPCSERLIEVISPYPSPGPGIVRQHYEKTELPVGCGDVKLTFPPEKESDGIELLGIMKGDHGAAAAKGALSVGDVLLCRGQQYRVKAVTGGGSKHEVYGGGDLVVFDCPFPFNAKKALGHNCSPIAIKAKHGFLPRSVLDEYEPITLRFSEHKQAKRFLFAVWF